MILSNVWTDSNFTWFYFWYELGKIMTRYDFLDARFVIWLAIDLLLLLVNIWFWAKNDQIWQPEARWMIFCNIRADFNFHFWSIFCGKKVNFKWRSYQADRPLVHVNIWIQCSLHGFCIVSPFLCMNNTWLWEQLRNFRLKGMCLFRGTGVLIWMLVGMLEREGKGGINKIEKF